MLRFADFWCRRQWNGVSFTKRGRSGLLPVLALLVATLSRLLCLFIMTPLAPLASSLLCKLIINYTLELASEFFSAAARTPLASKHRRFPFRMPFGVFVTSSDHPSSLDVCSYSAEQQGTKCNPMELSQFIDFVKRNKLQSESFTIGHNQYVVTSIHENWFSARCVNTSKPAGEGAIVMQTAAFLFVTLYDGSIGPASRAMATADQFVWQLGRKNL
ncbi:hypothetical protein Tsubulata_010973 [Turnera subulata]|uniref:Profilin n=1 Tax=Turnera subulata TaxID=218843 RepID=A0A9Q0GAV9_9ROSI|nr:hypothetical protein Tsubulata_010973 [Turnera subulata]